MSKIIVAGLFNIETTCPVNEFPVDYFPITYPFHRVASGISGVGYNLARNLKLLGDEVVPVSMLGNDLFGRLIRTELTAEGLDLSRVTGSLCATPQTVILYAPYGRREIYCDLKDYQDTEYDWEAIMPEIMEADAVMVCNSNFNRKLLRLIKEQCGRRRPPLLITDVHVLYSAEDGYNRDFLEAADVVFLSDEGIPGHISHEDFMRELYTRYHNSVIIMGRGSSGSLLYRGASDTFTEVKAVSPRQIVNTAGAGDALCSTFTHYFAEGVPADMALRYASVLAGYKIGAKVSSEGFLTAAELQALAEDAFPELKAYAPAE